MKSHWLRELGMMMLFVVALLAIGTWLDIAHPTFNEVDTMKYKLKYVRLRPIHEEERQRIQRSMSASETDSLEVGLRRVILTSASE
jgi:type II secretory pathway component PulM